MMSKKKKQKSVAGVPSFRRVMLSEGDFERIVGKRIKVFRPGSGKWFSARITWFDNENKLYGIRYDDGCRDELNLMEDQFELEILPGEVWRLGKGEVEISDMAKTHVKKSKSGPEGEMAEEFFSSIEVRPSRVPPRKDIRRVMLSENDFEKIVGRRVKVFRPGSGKWFSARITWFDNENKLYGIRYDDGCRDELNLMEDQFELEILPSEVWWLGKGEVEISDMAKTHAKKSKRGPEGEMAEAFFSSIEVRPSRVPPRKDIRRVMLSENDFEKIVGRRVKVFRPGSGKWFSAQITWFDNENKLYGIRYDDGCRDELNLMEDQFELEILPGEVWWLGKGEVEISDMAKTHAKKSKRGPEREMAEAFFSSIEVRPSRVPPRKDIPSFRRVSLSENDFERIVGRRVKVFRPGSGKWFSAQITWFDNENKLHSIQYDHGGRDQLNLMEDQFELEILPSEAFTLFLKSEPYTEIPGYGGGSEGTVNDGSSNTRIKQSMCKQSEIDLTLLKQETASRDKVILEEGREAKAQVPQSPPVKQSENEISLVKQETASDERPDAKASDSQTVSDYQAPETESKANVESGENPVKMV